jgi:gluconate kinase
VQLTQSHLAHIRFVYLKVAPELLEMRLKQRQGHFILVGVLRRTFIQTGLFIVAHDAIHGSVLSSNRKLNDAIGQFFAGQLLWSGIVPIDRAKQLVERLFQPDL